jgi:hypothetical protein
MRSTKPALGIDTAVVRPHALGLAIVFFLLAPE